VATHIQSKSGTTWYTDWTIQEVRAAINQDLEIPVWWFAPWGQRFSEKLFLREDELAHLRTESDDG